MEFSQEVWLLDQLQRLGIDIHTKVVSRNKRSNYRKPLGVSEFYFDEYKETGRISPQQKHFLLQKCKNEAQKYYKFSKTGNTYTINGIEVSEQSFNNQLNWINKTCEACFYYGEYVEGPIIEQNLVDFVDFVEDTFSVKIGGATGDRTEIDE